MASSTKITEPSLNVMLKRLIVFDEVETIPMRLILVSHEAGFPIMMEPILISVEAGITSELNTDLIFVGEKC